MVRCQIVFTVVVYLLSVSVFQVLKLFSPGRVSVYPCRVRTGLYSLPELETLHCRVYCTCTADDICTSTVFGVCTCTASLSHLHCVLELSNKDYLFFTRNWISSFLYRDTHPMLKPCLLHSFTSYMGIFCHIITILQ